MKEPHIGSRSFDPSAPADPDAGIFGTSTSASESLVHLIPVPFEATTSYGRGTSLGPQAILRASHQPDLFDLECGRPYEVGIHLLTESSEIRALNKEALKAVEVAQGKGVNADSALTEVNLAGEKVNKYVRSLAKQTLDDGKLVGLIGGDHASPFGLIEELSLRHPGMGILHLDAHHDLRESYDGFTWSHASIMFNVMTQLDGVQKLVQVGIRDFCEEEKAMADESDGVIVAFYDQDIARSRFRGEPWGQLAQSIVDELPQEVYISFDVDGLDPKLCPNTGTPVPGGLDFNEAIFLLSLVQESGRRIIGFDLCEVAPGRDEWDANVGARLLYKLIAYMIQTSPQPHP